MTSHCTQYPEIVLAQQILPHARYRELKSASAATYHQQKLKMTRKPGAMHTSHQEDERIILPICPQMQQRHAVFISIQKHSASPVAASRALPFGVRAVVAELSVTTKREHVRQKTHKRHAKPTGKNTMAMMIPNTPCFVSIECSPRAQRASTIERYSSVRTQNEKRKKTYSLAGTSSQDAVAARRPAEQP